MEVKLSLSDQEIPLREQEKCDTKETTIKSVSSSDEDVPRPRWVQVLHSSVVFLLCVCSVVFGDAVAVGVFNGIATSIETRYRLTAAELGMAVTTFCIGNMLALPFVSYFGGRPSANRPRWIAMGAVVIGVGIIIQVLPHFIFGKYDPVLSDPETTDEGGACSTDAISDHCDSFHIVGAQNTAAFRIILVGFAIVGAGYAAIPALALAYIDDNCRTETTALYAGIIQSMYGVGTIVGFFLASASLTFWVDFNRLEADTELPSPDHPAWVGAWWLAVLVSAAPFLITAIPLFGFPKQLPRRLAAEPDAIQHLEEEQTKLTDAGGSVGRESDDDNTGESVTTEGAIKGIAKTYLRLLSSPVPMFITLGMALQIAVLYGMTTFFAKYFETQFKVTASFAALLAGVTLVPPYGIGWILGGVIIRKYRMSYTSMFVFAISCIVAGLVGIVPMFFLGCNNPSIAGVTVGYQSQSPTDVSLVTECNANCSCTTASYQPVCDVTNDVIFISPCHAGCNGTTDTEWYQNCSCIEGSGSAMNGLCEFQCSNLVPFIIVQFLQTMFLMMAGVPQLILFLRFVEPRDKTAALGLNKLCAGLGGLIGPMLYGVFVDGSCLVWQSMCDERGYCMIYDIGLYRNHYMGVSLVLGILTIVCSSPALYFIRKTAHRRLLVDEKE